MDNREHLKEAALYLLAIKKTLKATKKRISKLVKAAPVDNFIILQLMPLLAVNEYYKETFNNPAFEKDIEEEIIKHGRNILNKAKSLMGTKYLALSMAVYSSNLAEKFIDEKKISKGMEEMAKANYYLGIYQKSIGAENDNLIARKMQAELAANKRHEKTKEDKARAIEHYKKNKHRFKTKDKAAEEIKKELGICYSFRTVRQWLNNK